MDMKHEEFQFLGIFGIFKESFKVILSKRKIFGQITLTLIVPYTLILLAHTEAYDLLFANVRPSGFENIKPVTDDRYSGYLSSGRMGFFLFEAAYLALLWAFSLSCTAAVVYAVASAYTPREITFKRVVSVVPRVWRRLAVTFLCLFPVVFLYSMIAGVVFIVTVAVTGSDTTVIAVVISVLVVVYVAGFVCFLIVWLLAGVVCVLESSRGIEALRKAKDLIKGNVWITVAAVFAPSFPFWGAERLFNAVVVRGDSFPTWSRVVVAVPCFFLLSCLFLLQFVVHTVLYLVCKWHHREYVDSSSLSDHLESYHGEYEPLSAVNLITLPPKNF